jgi:hypothetical protein
MRDRFTLFGGAGGMSTEEALLVSDNQLRAETFVPVQVPDCCMQATAARDHPWLGKNGQLRQAGTAPSTIRSR